MEQAELSLLKEYLCKKQYSEALHFAKELILKFPGNSELYFITGRIFSEQGHDKEALAFTKAALNLEKKDNYLIRAAELCNQASDYSEAEKYLAAVTPERRNNIDYLLSLSCIYQNRKEYKPAEETYLKALALSPNTPSFYTNLGVINIFMENFSKAEKYLLKALSLDAANPLIYYNLGLLKEQISDYRDALKYYNKALEICPAYPEALFNKSMIEMANGNYRQGLRDYEWRFYTADNSYELAANNLLNPESNLSAALNLLKDRTLFIRSEEGFGDSIQFVRYLKAFRELGVKIILEAPQELYCFYRESLSVPTEVVPQGTKNIYDFSLPVRSLPFLFSEILPFPYYEPYIFFKPSGKFRYLFGKSEKRKVGLVWKGNPLHVNDKNRSARPEDLKKLFQLKDTRFYSLQKNTSADEKAFLKSHNITDLSPHIHDFLDTAELISNLDMLITVDTSVAHLAGALNKKTILLLSYKSDLRWTEGVWYPSMVIYRQDDSKSWDTVCCRVVENE